MELQAADDTEEEDSLSLCDLPIYGDALDSEDFSRELHHQTSSSSSHSHSEDQQYFAFFCEEWSKSPTTKSHQPDENIFFCGKLIPYKQPPLIRYNHNPQHDKVLRWNSKSSEESISSKSNNSKSTSVQFPVRNDGKLDYKFDFSVRKVSMLAPPAKSRWYLFVFGLARFPVEMELRDIRRRQSRKSIKSNDKSYINRGTGGLWRIIRSLGCGGQRHSNASVEAAYSYAPQVVR
ncbi:hypothetical protein LguiB_003375 [Lonicera macranthoides]